MNTCEYCNKEFSSVYTLKFHQKSAKYCLEKRNNETPIISSCICNYCNKTFISKKVLNKHNTICKKKQEIEIKKDLEQNDQLKKDLVYKLELNNKVFDNKLETQRFNYEVQIKKLNEKYEIEKEKLSLEKEKNIRLESKIEFANINYKTLEKQYQNLQNNYDLLLNKISSMKTYNISQSQNNINYNTSLDYSQKFFDQHVEEKYTFRLYEEGKEGAKKLIISFLYKENNINNNNIVKEVIVSDNARDKIKITDLLGNTSTIDFEQLLNLCRESEILTSLLTKYSTLYFRRPEDPYNPLQNQVSYRNNLFKRRTLKKVYKDVKCYITETNSQQVLQNEIQNIENTNNS